jgi:hypothetical protein
MGRERDRNREQGELIERMTREISDVASGRREPARPVRTSDGPFSRVRMTEEEPVASHAQPMAAQNADQGGR